MLFGECHLIIVDDRGIEIGNVREVHKLTSLQFDFG